MVVVQDAEPANARTFKSNGSGLTVLVPAYNEAESIADTIRSIQAQTVPPDEIIVIDDFSKDNTGDIARSMGVTVMRPPKNTGSKAGAKNFAMDYVHTPYTMAIDADTTLAPNAIQLFLDALKPDEKIAAVCGFVLPRHVKTIWERGRYVEYMFAFTFFKPIQEYYEKPLISSGCFSAYRTDLLKAQGGWSMRTMAEDMDLTWSFYQAGHKVRFVPEAVCYPIEPHDYNFMAKQLKRWSHGFVQNVRVHWRGILEVPFLRSTIGVAMWDATIASFCYLFLLPLLSILISPLFLLGYLIDAPAVVIPVLVKGVQRKETAKALASLPSFFVLRIVNGLFMLKAFWSEIVMRKSLTVYEKGH